MHKLTQELLQHLPYRDSKEPDSNNYKIYRLLAEVIGTIQEHQQQIQDTRNIDNATGKTLELIGSNYNQPRGVDQDDDEYRLYIKTKIAADMSQGDIETLNEITEVLMGEGFVGYTETWNQEEFQNEPAGLLLTIRNKAENLPFDVVDRIVAAGVDVKWLLEFKQSKPEIFIGSTMAVGEEVEVYPWTPKGIELKAKINIAIGNETGLDNTTIYPKGVI